MCVCVCVVVHVCVSVLQAASCGELAGRMYGGYDSPNVCIDPSFLPPMLVNRWSGDRQARGLRKNERKRGGAKKREKKKRTAKQKEGNHLRHVMSCRYDR